MNVEWDVAPGLTDYREAVAAMEARAAAIRGGEAGERVWLVEHAPLYTAGTSADPAELIDPRFPVHATGRGGRYTYHGPGQRVGYLMLDLAARGRDVRHFVHSLENWIIATLGDFGIEARAEPGRVGIWTGTGANEAKIGAIGIRVRRWVTLHGFAVNIAPDLSHFGGIVPCGLGQFPVTSMAALGKDVGMAQFDAALQNNFPLFLQLLGQEQKSALEGGLLND
ncbi:lipoyl(octanoyl) transferase LipB [Stakelama pacifica]|uniref:Octanoyltransferase n=2 Tax=Stakelama pacifica TaxID=517720 RepID=A0A4R6FSG8_9SPHN|nr:lipoyl(octanoyl) transferase LipB [Stakelama pacifica]TDN84547.1 lipoyl(octanoyl) transferase [Stakelama pacifica]GGO93495.1 octanoyltransferase [Stakelama pacifica]